VTGAVPGSGLDRDHGPKPVLAIRRSLADGNPAITELGSDLAQVLMARGRVSREMGQPAAAFDLLQRAAAILDGLPTPSAGDHCRQACCHALLAGITPIPGSGMTAAKGRVEADVATESLLRAIAAGLRNTGSMRINTDLDSIRSRPDFRLLMMDLAIPAKPFAK
jgi:hypothetical protein